MTLLLDERFELSDQVGSGGFGFVYRAQDLFDGQPVAVKILNSRRAVDEGRFEREVALLSRLHHPSIVRYIAHGTAANGNPYLVMEWLEGCTLAARLRRGWLSLTELVIVALRVVDGLAAAASKGVIHRDVKPGNIFLPAGRIADTKLLDFGLARQLQDAETLTRSGVLLGTPLYMSPEQARGLRALDMSSDIFSLGCVLFECLCGVAPFESDTALATLGKICFEQPARIGAFRAEVPERLTRVVDAMLHKSPALRPSYAAIGAELRGLLQGGVGQGMESSASLAPETHELVISGARPESLHPRAQQRVLSAVFAGRTDEYSKQQLAQTLDVLLDRYGARCERLMDGSTILLLERQATPHEQAIAAAHCALSLRELLPNSPLVVCTARAVLEAGVPVGALLESGARLLNEVPQGTIRLDETSAALLEARFELRGTDGKRFLERERVGGDVPRTLLGRVTPFVGRERELGHVELLFRECVEEEVTRAVLVTAPAGAGKSRLRFELIQRLRRAEADLTLLTGAGDAVRTGAPFSTLAPALRRLAGIDRADDLKTKRAKLAARIAAVVAAEHLPRIAGFLGEMLGLGFAAPHGSELEVARNDPQVMSERIRASWLEWLEAECRARPVVILIDDLHWSDQASVQFLEASLRGQAQRTLLLVALARPEVRERFPNLWAERELIEIRLSKLGNRACEKLLAAFPDTEVGSADRQWMIERADGNPFFLEELIRSSRSGGQRDLPDSVLATIQARLDTLGEDAKLLLRIASVFGQDFRVDAVEALLGEQARRFDLKGWLKVLVERELVFPRNPGDLAEYSFRHALVRDAAYALLAQEERAIGHRLAADWLEMQGASEPAVLAEHFELGGALEQAAKAYAQATAVAHEANALEDVIRLGERAVACSSENALVGEVGALIAEAWSYQGDQNAAQSWAERSKAVLRPGDPGWWRACQVLASALLIKSGNWTYAALVANELVACDAGETASSERLIALSIVARNAQLTGGQELAKRMLEALGNAAKAELLPRVQGTITSLQMQIAGSEGHFAAAVRLGRATLAAFQRAGALHDACNTVNDLGHWLLAIGAQEEAKQLLQQGLANPHATAADRHAYQQNLGLLAIRNGDLVLARQLLEESEEGLARATFMRERALSLAYLAEANLALGRLREAEAQCDEALSLNTSADAATYALTVGSRLQLRRGAAERALGLADRACAILADAFLAEHHVLVTHGRIECLLATGHELSADQELKNLHAWLCERAGAIDAADERRAYLENVPENVLALALARTRLGLQVTP